MNGRVQEVLPDDADPPRIGSLYCGGRRDNRVVRTVQWRQTQSSRLVYLVRRCLLRFIRWLLCSSWLPPEDGFGAGTIEIYSLVFGLVPLAHGWEESAWSTRSLDELFICHINERHILKYNVLRHVLPRRHSFVITCGLFQAAMAKLLFDMNSRGVELLCAIDVQICEKTKIRHSVLQLSNNYYGRQK